MNERTYKNNHGLIEIYGRSDRSNDSSYARKEAERIGVHISSKHQDEPLRSSDITMTPQMAREVAHRILEWADYIESHAPSK